MTTKKELLHAARDFVDGFGIPDTEAFLNEAEKLIPKEFDPILKYVTLAMLYRKLNDTPNYVEALCKMNETVAELIGDACTIHEEAR